MKKITTFFILIFTIFAFGQSIDYRNASHVPGSNYYEVVSQMRKKISAKKASKKLTRSDVKTEKHFERWAYFWRDRINADGSFPSVLLGWENAGLLGNDLNSKELKEKQSKAAFSSEIWTNIGPQENPDPNGFGAPPQLGRINAFWRFKSGNDANDILIVGTPTGGIWKSVNNGTTWQPKFDTFAGIGITDIKGSSAINGTPGVLYVTTGDWDSPGTLKGIGVYKSTNYGETWVATSGLSGDLADNGDSSFLGQLVVIDDNTAIVAAKNNILKTVDGGNNWVSKKSEFDGRFGRMASYKSGTDTNIVCANYWGGVFFSLDSGETWDEITPSGSSANNKVVAVDKEGVKAGTFYVQGVNGRLQELNLENKTATNIGTARPATATSTSTFGTYDSQSGYNQALTVRNSFFLEGAVAGQASINNGTDWYLSLNGYKTDPSHPGVYVHSDHHQMGYLNAGNSFWDANDGGLSFIEFNSTPDLTNPTVTYKTNGVINTQVYTISINPNSANNDDFMMANQDNDGYSKESGTWYGASAGDGVCSAIDFSNPNLRYIGGTEGALYRSYGTTGFAGQYNGDSVPKPAKAQFVWPFSLDTSSSAIAYGGFDDMYRSTNISTIDLYPTVPNASEVWTDLNAGAGTPITFDNQGNNIAVVGTTGLRRSANAGSSWTTINQPIGAEINSFSIDGASTNGNTIYATAKSYNSGNKVFKSIDGGVTWLNISGNMPNILMKKVMLKQNQSQEFLFVATELGVYATNNGGVNWDKLGANLPNVIVNDLEINYLADKLFIGTYGRGMWSINISNATLGSSKLEVANSNAIKVYPNPVRKGSDLKIKIADESNSLNYVIYNAVGGLVKQGQLNSGINIINIDTITSGIYIIRMTNGKYASSQKIIVN